MQKKQSYYVQSDLLILIVLFIVASLMAVYNAQQLKQYDGENSCIEPIAWFAVGGLFIASVQFLDMEQLYKGSVYIYIGSILLLLLLYISPESIAKWVNGAKSWFNPSLGSCIIATS